MAHPFRNTWEILEASRGLFADVRRITSTLNVVSSSLDQLVDPCGKFLSDLGAGHCSDGVCGIQNDRDAHLARFCVALRVGLVDELTPGFELFIFHQMNGPHRSFHSRSIAGRDAAAGYAFVRAVRSHSKDNDEILNSDGFPCHDQCFSFDLSCQRPTTVEL